MPASDDDREMMARFNDTFRKLKTNREQVPLEVLQTKYGKAYQKLTKEMADLADWFAARLRERMPFPMHPKDIAGNRQLSQQIAAVLAEESQPGALMDQYRKALIDDLDYDKFLDLVWQLYHRTRKPTNPTGKNTTSGTFTRTATAGSGITSQDSSGRTASRETIRIHSPTREATGWTPKESTKAQPFPLTSKETRYGQRRIDRPV